MKLTQMLSLVTVIFLGVSCKDAKKTTKTSNAGEVSEHPSTYETYIIDTSNSNIAWLGSTPVDGHNGTIKLSNGRMGFEKGVLKSGNFEIDMNSIAVLDLKDPEENGDLVGHLKNEDFFEVDKFPQGQFEIISISTEGNENTLKGNLTLKGITKSIEFPIDLHMQGNQVAMTSQPFYIDRTEWGIIYKSGTFFKDLKDEFIKDEIGITLNITGSLE